PAQQPARAHPAFSQHGCPASPQATSDPALQTTPASVLLPDGAQLPLTLQPPAAQPPSAHAGPKAVPHVLQVPLLPEAFAPVQVRLGQHSWPAPPHWVQVLVPKLQTVPVAVQVLKPPPPGQQGWPAPPHAAQVGVAPPVQARLPAVQVAPAQQGCPAPPH